MSQHLIASLGNPSPDYDGTRHNLGRVAVERWLGELTAYLPREAPHHRAEWGSLQLTATRIPHFTGQLYKLPAANCKLQAIVVPDLGTYMNESGPAIAVVANFFKISPEHIVVVHDDTDLPLGALRVSKDSAAAGHRGVESVIGALGTKNFIRLRLGIESRINKSIPPTEDFVLEKFSADEQENVDDMVRRGISALNTIAAKGPEQAMTNYNSIQK